MPHVDNALPPDMDAGDPYPDNTLPGMPYPDNALPGEQPEIDNELPAYPDNELPATAELVGELAFYQRKTLGIKWDATLLEASTVAIYVDDGVQWSCVRTVPNNGSSSVTFPVDFTGQRGFRVSSPEAYCEGTTIVK